MRKRRVLVFDDEEIIIYLFKSFFNSMGYDVITFREPVICPVYYHSAESCGQEYPCADVMITEFKMPRMTGIQLLERQAAKGCRMMSKNKALISGHIDKEHHQSLETLGSVFFQKPVDFAVISNWLAACEKRSDLSQPLATRRNQERQSGNYEITCRLGDGDMPLRATVVDISSSGLCIRIGAPLVRGQVVRIVAGLPDSFSTARVVWVIQRADGSSVAGLACD
jgi:CheY-like chemotaxis protein